MTDNPLASLAAYSRFVADQVNRSNISHATITVWSASPYTGIAEGEIFLVQEFRLRLREELDFEACLITAYGYEIYQNNEKIYWYDDFPHPNDPTLASTHPHHKHVPPNIKRNRAQWAPAAPGISFTKPNLPQLIQEIEELIQKTEVNR